ncbi:sodium/calcium exchanger protein [Chloropicon primus]|uniref:Sodium/calcium exchanger protein n=2 Tax=Chloropicon primus TaxID=1764295 RepID=A0A5B8ME40_9CHLO|nr:sodium/calcium exchanger protein [Chloropicon primus]UPQ96780.1 sodium/calcium exchanger protein [Chloropicon primus]|eukprot:QDZ17562.1 sodium/calcium exchanger protein [Chloropicon primus]
MGQEGEDRTKRTTRGGLVLSAGSGGEEEGSGAGDGAVGSLFPEDNVRGEWRVRRQLTLTDDEDDTAGLLKGQQPFHHERGREANGVGGATMAETWKSVGSASGGDSDVFGLPFSPQQGEAGKASAGASSGSSLADVLLEAKNSTGHMILGTKMNVLLVCAPLAWASNHWSWGSGLTAVLALLALCPLAERLGFTTEQLALRTNDTLGALLNVTFGNATELILSIVALKQAEITLIQMSLIGSILSNQFLVLGSAMVVGGLKHGVQLFERTSAVLHLSLLVGSSVALLIPMAMSYAGGETGVRSPVAWLSRIISVVMIAAYGLFLYCILKREKSQIKPSPPESSRLAASAFSILHKSVTRLHRSSMERPAPFFKAGTSPDIELGSAMGSGRSTLESARSLGSLQERPEEEEEEEAPVISTLSGVLWLGLVAILISVMSDILVDNIEAGAAQELHVPSSFLYTIIVPIVGNAAEHTSALIFSYRDKPDIAFGIAVGSSVQIALLVIPACVLIAWPMGQDLTLRFGSFETCVYAASVLLLFTTISDGLSNWTKGALLITSYLVIAIGVWFQ